MSLFHAPATFRDDIHPRILLSEEDMPAFRERVKDGAPARAMVEVLRRCEQYCDPSSELYVDTARGLEALLAEWKNGVGSIASIALNCLGFAFAATGDIKWAEKAIAILLAMVSEDSGGKDISHVTLGVELPLAYDLVHSAMTSAQRKKVDDCLRAHAVVPYQDDILSTPARHVTGLGTNMFIHRFEMYVFALAATYDHDRDADALQQCADLMRMTVHLGIDEGGQIGEGSSYGWGDAWAVASVAWILQRAGVADLWEEEQRFREFYRQWAWLTLPGGRGMNTIGDAWRFAGRRPSWGHLIMARRSEDPVIQWIWEYMLGRGERDGIGKSPECFSTRLGYAALLESDAVRAKRPSGKQWPLARTSGTYGVTVIKSGWKDDDLYFSLLAAGRHPGTIIHQHCDAGHFSLFAQGEAYSVDTGYGDIMARYHSVMIPQGKEPSCCKEEFNQIYVGGRTDAFGAGKKANYVRVNTGQQWDCVHAYRHALVVNGPGVYPYVVLLDNMNFNNRLGCFQWLINSEPGNEITVDGELVGAVIQGQKNRLEIAWSYPSASDYPEQHRMELVADEINSFPLDHRVCDVNYFTGLPGEDKPNGGARWGAGIRPRVNAMLFGYNGSLLTAMVPRRKGESSVKTRRIQGPAHFGLVVEHGEMTDTIVASPISRNIDLGGLKGEASLAVARRDASGKLVWWAAGDAYALAVDGKDVMPRQGVVKDVAEWA